MLMKLTEGSQPLTKEILLKETHVNLVNMIDEQYTPVPKFFTGDEEERVEWVKNVIQEVIELNWHHFDKDNNRSLDEEECFTLIQDLQPKRYLEREGFHNVFKLYDTNGDGEFDKAELAVLLHKIHGDVAVYSQEKILINMNDNLKQLIIDNNVARVFKGTEADRLVWV